MIKEQVHCLISGVVQGVGYRYWTQQQALQLGLSGWVQNQANGCVAAVFIGPAEKVETMLTQCRNGPSAATVTTVELQSSSTTDLIVQEPAFKIL